MPMPLAVSTFAIAGFAALVAGGVWCFVYNSAQNQIGLEVGKWKLTGLPTGAILLAAGVGLLYLDNQQPAGPEAPEVSEVSLATSDGQPSVSANVRCPFTVDLTGRISVTGGKGDVAYRFVRSGFQSEDRPTAVQRIHVDGAGSHAVHDSYTFNIPVGDLYLADRLEVLSPSTARSEAVVMRVRCDANLPEGPTEPPPDVAPPGSG